MSNKKRFWIFLVLSLGWMFVIFLFSAQNKTESANLSNGLLERLLSVVGLHKDSMQESTWLFLKLAVRKAAHFSVYSVLAVLVTNALLGLTGKNRAAAVIAVGVCMLYAVSDELHQSFVSGRVASIWDVGIDTLGAVFGAFLFHIFSCLLRRRRRKKLL